jgi:acyl carrier protein
MDDPHVYDRLTKIFQDVFDDDTMVVTGDLTADSVADWDSLTHLRLMLSVERGFGVKFSASEIGRLKNVGELVDLIEAKL